jgi:hypothetical protein
MPGRPFGAFREVKFRKSLLNPDRITSPSPAPGGRLLKLLQAISLLLVLVAVAALVLFGIVGIGRGGSQEETSDVIYLYGAGRCWWDGQNPYDFDNYQPYTDRSGARFAYPPSVAPLCLTLATLPLPSARILMAAVNVSCLLALTVTLVLSVRRLLAELPPPDKAIIIALVAAVAIGNPFTAHVVWMGQMSLLAAAAAVGSWVAYTNRRMLIAGFLVGVAAVKPQIAVLIYVWYLLDRQWRVLGVAAATIAALAILPLWWHGPELLVDWLSAVAAYQDVVHNRIDFQHVFGVRSLLSSVGLSCPSLLPMALGGAIFLYAGRARLLTEDILPLLMCLSCLFAYAHDYDLVALLTLAGPLLLHLRRRPFALVLLLLAALVLFFPQRFVRDVSWPWVIRYREFATLLLMFWLVVLSIKRPVPCVEPDEDSHASG